MARSSAALNAIRDLVRREIAVEDPETAALVRRLRQVRARGAFTRAEFLAMCRWKSPRSIRECARNREATIARVSRVVLATRDERDRIERLLSLRGVGVPSASAILTLVDPRRYGVLDIRAWQLLFETGCVSRNPAGVGFGVAHWEEYLQVLRSVAAALRVSVRRVERTLFLLHRARQEGRLYGNRGRRRARPRTLRP